MSEMLDRVAKAIEEKMSDPTDLYDSVALAAAAIAAMREPTEAMKNAAVAADMEAQVLGDGQIVAQWQIMIDEALK